MNYGKNKHYQNKHGQELNEFLKAKLYPEELKIWYILQAVKYQARLGKKDAIEKDLGKKNDYLNELGLLYSEKTQKAALQFVNEFVAEFEEWEGKK